MSTTENAHDSLTLLVNHSREPAQFGRQQKNTMRYIFVVSVGYYTPLFRNIIINSERVLVSYKTWLPLVFKVIP